MPDESERGLGLRVRPVVEIAVGNRSENAQSCLRFVFEIGGKKISYGLGLVGIHRMLPFFD